MSVKVNLLALPEKIDSHSSSSADLLTRLTGQLQREKDKRRKLEQKLKEQRELVDSQRAKILFADSVSVSRSTLLVGELAKILKQNGFDTGQNRLFERLRMEGYLYRTNSGRNLPTQRALERGLFCVKATAVTQADGRIVLNWTPKVTAKGQVYFVKKYLG